MKNKGFTLVELLGVIVVLAIIALIAVPTILGIIEKSRKGALQNSGYGLVEAGTLYNAQYQNEQTSRFDIKDNEVTTEEENKLTYKGDIKEGTVLVNNNGEVTVCINDGKYAAYKNFKDNKVIVVEGRTCNIPENSNIVYLDNDATIDINIEELVSKINQLEQEVKSLKEEKASQTEITNQITNLNNTHNTDITLLNNKLGNTDISSIGNGTITNAIASLNNSLADRKNLVSTTHLDEPWYAIKENWNSLEVGRTSYGQLNANMAYGYIFTKTNAQNGTGLIYGYASGSLYHVYVGSGSFSVENISVHSLTSF